MTTITAAERYAALTALKAGLDDQIARARSEALEEVRHLRKASFTTPYGQVNVSRAEPRVRVDPDLFMTFVAEHYPDEIVETTTRTVRSSFARAFEAELTAVAGEVVHKGTGDLVEFATVSPEGDPVISYPASTAQRDAKAYARMLFEDRALSLVTGLREVTGA